ncbi:MAG: aspartate ammonia-lyase [Candidatus Melainabacteria bacterium]|nr:aspartate ammonia-lyase [Candidatus Melainabacteria bacterium]
MTTATDTKPNQQQATRQEKDSLGVREVPAEAYYGIQALRGSENFPMTGIKPAQQYPELIWAFGCIKKAAARTNMELQLLEPHQPELNQKIGQALMDAATEMIEGRFNQEFIVDVYQGGTGTSNHMNANEILSNRANELLGGQKGVYSPVNPNDHANYGQSTNDVTPTVMRLTFLKKHGPLIESLCQLEASFRRKADAFQTVLIAGRTHMQDAVPLTMGQQFAAYANALEDARAHLEFTVQKLYRLGLGASALGTGLNTHPEYRRKVTGYLAEYTGFPLEMARDYFQATSSFGLFSDYSSALRSVAIELEKIAHDFKLYSSGPMTAIAELNLPQLQPGSSIMPGKVNPVLPELMDQLSYAIQGNDLSVALCAQNGQWQLNVMMPLILIKITESQTLLTNGLKQFAEQCVDGVTVNETFIRQRMEHSTILLTALNPYIGYAHAAEIAKKVIAEGKTVREVALSLGLTDKSGRPIDAARLDEILSVEAMTAPRIAE